MTAKCLYFLNTLLPLLIHKHINWPTCQSIHIQGKIFICIVPCHLPHKLFLSFKYKKSPLNMFFHNIYIFWVNGKIGLSNCKCHQMEKKYFIQICKMFVILVHRKNKLNVKCICDITTWMLYHCHVMWPFWSRRIVYHSKYNSTKKLQSLFNRRRRHN
jgi:hypothetical protein